MLVVKLVACLPRDNRNNLLFFRGCLRVGSLIFPAGCLLCSLLCRVVMEDRSDKPPRRRGMASVSPSVVMKTTHKHHLPHSSFVAAQFRRFPRPQKPLLTCVPTARPHRRWWHAVRPECRKCLLGCSANSHASSPTSVWTWVVFAQAIMEHRLLWCHSSGS